MGFTASAPGADWFEWDFYGDGSIWYPSATGNMQWTYNNPGTYNIMVNVGLNGQSKSCTATATH